MDQHKLQQFQQNYHSFVRKRTENWCRQDTLQLIHFWKTNVRHLKGIKRNYHVYQKLADELSQFGVKRTPREVKTKIANLAADYRKEQCKIRNTGKPSNWKYWKEVDEVFTLLHKFENHSQLEMPFTTPPNSEHSITIVPLPRQNDNENNRRMLDNESEGNYPVLSISDVRSVVDEDTRKDDGDNDNDSLKILSDNSSSYDNSTVSNLAHSILSPPGTSDTDNRDNPNTKPRGTSPDRQSKLLNLILEEQRRLNQQFAIATERSHKLQMEEIELRKKSLAVQERIASCMETFTQYKCGKSNSNAYRNTETDSSNDGLHIDESIGINGGMN